MSDPYLANAIKALTQELRETNRLLRRLADYKMREMQDETESDPTFTRFKPDNTDSPLDFVKERDTAPLSMDDGDLT